MSRLIKYLIYYLVISLIGYVSMFLIFPRIRGGLIGMFVGILIGQLIFSQILLIGKWYYRFLIGLIIAVIGLTISWWVLLFTAAEDVNNVPKFFISYLLVATLMMEKINRWNKHLVHNL